ncbi:MAG: peptidyl-prolyl cis-trans isomerase [Verrucomicrobiota bacterium]
MLTQFRHIQKGTLIVVTIIIVIAFAFLYSDFDFMGTVGSQKCAVKAYDRCYRLKEVQKLATSYDVATMLGMGEFANVLFGENRQDQDRVNFVLSLIILREEALKMGIEPDAEEIKKAIPELPVFQQPWVTAEFIENNVLGPNGFSDGDLAQLVKDYLVFERLRDLIGSGVESIPSETEKRYIRSAQRYDVSLIEFDREQLEAETKVSEEEIKTYYEENQESLMSDPKRAFDYAKFEPKELPDDATNEQRSRAQLDFANAVNRVYADLAEKEADFMAVAKQHTGEQEHFIKSAGSFEPFASTSPPEGLGENETLLETIFSGALQIGSVTVPVPTGDGGYYVFYVKEMVDPQPLTLDQAGEAIESALIAKKSNRSVNDAASAARAEINEDLEAGTPFAKAVKEAGLKSTQLPNFSAREPLPEREDTALIYGAVDGLAEGELSSVVELAGGKGYLLAFVDKVQLYEDPERDASERAIAASTELGLRRALFSGWFNQRKLESSSAR